MKCKYIFFPFKFIWYKNAHISIIYKEITFTGTCNLWEPKVFPICCITSFLSSLLFIKHRRVILLQRYQTTSPSAIHSMEWPAPRTLWTWPLATPTWWWPPGAGSTGTCIHPFLFTWPCSFSHCWTSTLPHSSQSLTPLVSKIIKKARKYLSN